MVLLESVRVLDLAGGDADAVTRLLADLGADVLKVEPPGGSPARTAPPLLGGVSIAFALHNANKRSVTLDPGDQADRRRFDDLAATADIVVDSARPGRTADFGTSLFGTSCAELADRFGHLVTMSVTDFGTSGPRSRWQATDAVLYGLSGALSRSGPTIGTPVLPPEGIASATAAVQAAWAVLVAYYNRLRCGTGDYIDFSRFDAVVTVLDPIFGAQGQVAAARRGASRWRGRPRNQDAYPIYACRDGYVRLCVMSPRQWRGLWTWLGEPAEYADPKFGVIGERFAVWPQISVLVRNLFADQDMAELVAAGQARGVPIAAVGEPAQVLAGEHFAAAGAATEAELAPGLTALIPTGYYVVDDHRAGFRTPAPTPGDASTGWRARTSVVPTPGGAIGSRPFEGVRIVDLGVIVAGGEASRLFGDLGAEIIKVESAAYPDGLRQTRAGSAMSESFAWTHRNNLGLGLDLRNPAGKEIFGRLVADADAVFANFKPGTLAALGFSYEKLRDVNPRVVLAESSAFGESGPWSNRMGYGPLVRATTGVTALWTDPDETSDPGRHPFYDATTVFPDHVVARVTAIGALAALIAARRSGNGVHVHVSQAEAAVNQLDTCYVARAAGASVQPDTGVDLVCPCSGEDEWCVISIHTDDDWRCVAAAFEDQRLASDPRFGTGAARTAHRAELVEQLGRHTSRRTPADVGQLLQAAGVAAAAMNRPPDIAEDPQLAHRTVFAEMTHPLIEHPLPAETGPAPFRNIPQAAQRPAPLPGQDTRAICRTVLGFDDGTTERLIADGVLFG
ncbi:putative CoA-transferase [Mycolicibacter terrae]|uniref:CoA-transferase n=1 Tax=Mycolicibacter terrae TaxID=1788 RepID=A0AAD1MI67_9MYCO|nr:CoA transferase [Mycolicibacter terrae]ORW97572.1 acyl-CoA transferase [Mycolicibacter terrae]BBX22739.1 putative CoA-transferase [Mycolicibacter terrae]SNV72155.1 acyl-CoA transferase [Mycolicibacter terrae]